MSGGALLEGYDVVVCTECGFGFADHLPEQAIFDAYYRDMSKYEYQDQGGVANPRDLARFEAIAKTIGQLLPSHEARVLDVGCATGGLLAALMNKGYAHVVGLDPSPQCAASAQSLYGIRVVTGAISEIAELMAAEQPFDCVILSGVLEHIRDVGPTVARMRALLSARGLIFIEVPDATEFSRWPDAPFQEFSTEHINFFSATSLTNLMQRNGFTRVLCEQTTRDQSDSTVMPVVSAIYQRSPGEGGLPLSPDAGTETGLARYIKQSRQVEERVHRIVNSLVENATPLIVWGVGTHTLRLLATSRLAQANIQAFVDSNVRYQGKQLNGLPILAPAELRGRSEPILISSRVFQSAIERQIREVLRLSNEVITLYQL